MTDRRQSREAMLIAERASKIDPTGKLRRSQVWCKNCGHTEHVNNALVNGWPKHCGYTMTIDPPEEWND